MWLLRLHCEYEEQRYNQRRWWIYVQGWPPVQQRQSMLRIIGTFLSSRGGAGLALWDHAHSIFMFRHKKPYGSKSLRYQFASLTFASETSAGGSRFDICWYFVLKAHDSDPLFSSRSVWTLAHIAQSLLKRKRSNTVEKRLYTTDSTPWRNVYRCKHRYRLSLRKTWAFRARAQRHQIPLININNSGKTNAKLSHRTNHIRSKQREFQNSYCSKRGKNSAWKVQLVWVFLPTGPNWRETFNLIIRVAILTA